MKSKKTIIVFLSIALFISLSINYSYFKKESEDKKKNQQILIGQLDRDLNKVINDLDIITEEKPTGEKLNSKMHSLETHFSKLKHLIERSEPFVDGFNPGQEIFTLEEMRSKMIFFRNSESKKLNSDELSLLIIFKEDLSKVKNKIEYLHGKEGLNTHGLNEAFSILNYNDFRYREDIKTYYKRLDLK